MTLKSNTTKIFLSFGLMICASTYADTNDELREVTDTYRSNPERIKDFQVQDNGTVIDNRTNLQWMRCSYGQTWSGTACEGEPTQLTWQEAVELKHSFAGHDDWHLPTRYEQETLIYCSSGKDGGRVDKNHKMYKMLPRMLDSVQKCKGKYDKPTIFQDIFPNTQPSPYWTSTPTNIKKGVGVNSAWATYFRDGSGSFGIPRDRARFIRLVRNAQ